MFPKWKPGLSYRAEWAEWCYSRGAAEGSQFAALDSAVSMLSEQLLSLVIGVW